MVNYYPFYIRQYTTCKWTLFRTDDVEATMVWFKIILLVSSNTKTHWSGGTPIRSHADTGLWRTFLTLQSATVFIPQHASKSCCIRSRLLPRIYCYESLTYTGGSRSGLIRTSRSNTRMNLLLCALLLLIVAPTGIQGVREHCYWQNPGQTTQKCSCPVGEGNWRPAWKVNVVWNN